MSLEVHPCFFNSKMMFATENRTMTTTMRCSAIGDKDVASIVLSLTTLMRERMYRSPKSTVSVTMLTVNSFLRVFVSFSIPV